MKKTNMFNPVSTNISFPGIEEEILKFWQKEEIFKKSLQLRRGHEEYVFYDGPPFATGLPHYGHLLAGTIKDVIPRYQTMRGKYVDRGFGWDCHGLPVENEMEKELGLSSKHEIEEYGVAKFNEACRSIVLRHTREWQRIVTRSGRWVDFENGYRTMDRDYMESIWWVFRQLWDQDLIYEGHKIMWYCPRCATPLSNFEVNQGYAEVEDPAVTVRFRDMTRENTWFLAWTTTPWTLPGNLALTVGPDLDYAEIEDGGDRYIVGESLLPVYWSEKKPAIVRRYKGKELTGRAYLPLFPYFEHLRNRGAFQILTADFVNVAEGTGIVHTAPGFGEDDAAVAGAAGIPAVCPIDEEGRYTEEVWDYHSRFVKDCEKDIMRRLKQEGLLIHRTSYKHNYPHCWRCETSLLNKAIATWFLKVEAVKDGMIKANQKIHWVPGHLKNGRFGKWLEQARDWAISRNRYWGCPLPIWRNRESGESVCIGSVAELERKCGRPVKDIHKHFVDNITLPGEAGGELTRVPEVLDCWFESGSMPYAQYHYPFANRERLENNFPADFIAEGLDQTRGWFYTLLVIATALFDQPPFQNVIVNGLVLAEDGRKMSKRLKNYPEPDKIMTVYGADAMRLTMLSSPAVRAEGLRFSESAVQEIMRTVILPLWNAYSFFVTYARVDQWQPSNEEHQADSPPRKPENLLDRWILARLQSTIAEIRQAMDHYELQPAAMRFTGFIEDLTNWYIRRSRRRFWKSQNDNDKNQAYQTLYHVLLTFCKISCPFIPFITEAVWRNLRTLEMPESVHLCDFPEPCHKLMDTELERRMSNTMQAVSLGRYLRSQASLRVRQPLAAAVLVSPAETIRNDLAAMRETIAEELNVKLIEIRADEETLVDLSAKANFRSLGPRLGAKMKEAARLISSLDRDSLKKTFLGESLTLRFQDHQQIILEPEDIIIQRHEKPGMTVANEGTITVALNTELNEELILEGWARELVNRIQNLRKEQGLEVADHIRVVYDLPPRTREAIVKFKDYIARETLAETVEEAPLSQTEPVIINEQECRLQVSKV